MQPPSLQASASVAIQASTNTVLLTTVTESVPEMQARYVEAHGHRMCMKPVRTVSRSLMCMRSISRSQVYEISK